MSYLSLVFIDCVLSVFLICEAAHVQQEVGLTEMTPEISITANYIFVMIPSFGLMKLYAPAQLPRRLLTSFNLQR